MFTFIRCDSDSTKTPITRFLCQTADNHEHTELLFSPITLKLIEYDCESKLDTYNMIEKNRKFHSNK